MLTACVGLQNKITAPDAISLQEIEGSYSYVFRNELVITGERYDAGNILQIAKINDDTAYVSMNLSFYNGHSGGIEGIARLVDNKLILEKQPYVNEPEKCVVTLTFSKDNIVTSCNYAENPVCTYYHGARGTLDGHKFPRKSKRKIHKLDELGKRD
jgi:hypothetical protein